MACLMVLLAVMGACFLWSYAFVLQEGLRCRNNHRLSFPECRARWIGNRRWRSPRRNRPAVPFSLQSQKKRTRATMSSDSVESQISCAALPDLCSGQSLRRPPPRRGSTRNAAASPLPLPLACEERRGASDRCGRRSRAQQHRCRRKRRIFRWSAISCGGPPGGDVYQFLVYHSMIWTTTLTNTCLETVLPINGGTFAMTFCPCDCTRGGTPPMQHEIYAQIDPSLRKTCVDVFPSSVHSGALNDTSLVNSSSASRANGGTRATMKVHSGLPCLTLLLRP